MILVTGATGLIGSVLTRQLVDAGQAVRIFRRPTSRLDLLGVAADHVEHATGDLTEARSVRRAMADVQRVYHVAALVGPAGRHARAALRRVNVEGTAHVVNAALDADVERLVHTSSIAALGDTTSSRAGSAPPVIDESASWQHLDDPSAYAQSKRDAELEVRRGLAEGLQAVIVNPALVFGIGREGENTRRIVDAVRARRLPAIPQGGTCVVDAEDVAAGQRRAMRHGEAGRRYLLGSENLSWRTICETLAAAFGTKAPRYNLPTAPALAAGAIAEAVAALTRTRPLLTRRAARSASTFRRYANRRAVEELGCAFRPFTHTARRLAEAIG